jgi:hypothetical protein
MVDFLLGVVVGLALGLIFFARELRGLPERILVAASSATHTAFDDAAKSRVDGYVASLDELTRQFRGHVAEGERRLASAQGQRATDNGEILERLVRIEVLLQQRRQPLAAEAFVEAPSRSAEDEARIASRHAELVAEAEARGHGVAHCEKSYLCRGDCACLCGCDPCVGWVGLREQAERDVLALGLRAAAAAPRPEGRRHSTGSDGTRLGNSGASATTLASMQAVTPRSRSAPTIEIEDRSNT